MQARSFQQSFRDAVSTAKKCTGGPLGGALEGVDKGLAAIFGCVTGTGELAGPEASLSHIASRNASADASSIRAKPVNVPPADLKLDSPDAHGPRDHPKWGV